MLAGAGLLSPELHVPMRRMVGFRNIVVHEYTAVDAEHVVRILRNHWGRPDRVRGGGAERV